jgi:hypothetical protein
MKFIHYNLRPNFLAGMAEESPAWAWQRFVYQKAKTEKLKPAREVRLYFVGGVQLTIASQCCTSGSDGFGICSVAVM